MSLKLYIIRVHTGKRAQHGLFESKRAILSACCVVCVAHGSAKTPAVCLGQIVGDAVGPVYTKRTRPCRHSAVLGSFPRRLEPPFADSISPVSRSDALEMISARIAGTDRVIGTRDNQSPFFIQDHASCSVEYVVLMFRLQFPRELTGRCTR